jgi:hypothetical protein
MKKYTALLMLLPLVSCAVYYDSEGGCIKITAIL